jgi:hypothetical protein
MFPLPLSPTPEKLLVPLFYLEMLVLSFYCSLCTQTFISIILMGLQHVVLNLQAAATASSTLTVILLHQYTCKI